MAVNSANLVLGPARLYVASSGAQEPPDSDVTPNGIDNPPDPDVWVDVGGTDGGITFEVDSTYTDLTVDQVIMAVGSRLTEIKMSAAAKLSEMTLDNFQVALNQVGVAGSGDGFETLDIPVTSAGTQPTYAAVLIDGFAPYLATGPALRRIIIRKVLSQTKASLAYDKKTQQSFDCTFPAYFVSDTINPVHIVDQTAA